MLAGTNNGGEINYVNINTATITSKHDKGVGAIVGLNSGAGTIKNCQLSAIDITGTKNVGGAVGLHQGKTIEDVDVTTVTISGESELGGLVGTAMKADNGSYSPEIKSSTVDGGTITASKSTSAVDNIRGETSGWISSYSTRADSYFKDGANAGGIVGNLSTNAKLTNSQVLKITVNAIIGAGGVVGLVESTAEVNNNNVNFTGTTASDIVVGNVDDGSYVIGGIAGINKGTIKGSSNSKAYVTLGKNRTDITTRHDAAIGGVAGVTMGGTIDGVTIESSTLYGNKLIGGLVGYAFSGGKVTNSEFKNSTIYSQSRYDMDEFNGFVSDLKLGITSNTGFTDTNFKTHFGLGGDNATLFNSDYSIYYYAMEYGGIEPKLGTSTNIQGKESFKVLIGLLSGGYGTAPSFTGSSATGSVIKDLYDEYRTYVVDVTSYSIAGSPNSTTFSRKIQKGIRKFDTNANESKFYHGSESYKKYTDAFNDIPGTDSVARGKNGKTSSVSSTPTSSYTAFTAYTLPTLMSAHRDASKAEKDLFVYMEDAYNTFFTHYAVGNYYRSGDSYASITSSSVTSLKNTYAFLKMKDETYPGLVWQTGAEAQKVSATTEVDTKSVTYYGTDKWFNAIPLNSFKDISFTDTGGGNNYK